MPIGRDIRARLCTTLAVAIVACVGCSENQFDSPSFAPAIASAHFAVLETELSPAILVHSDSKYLALFADADAPEHIAFVTRNGPRSFKRGEKLKAGEMEECWLLLWDSGFPPWVVYLQRKPLALTLDEKGLHFSFANGAGDVVLLPLLGSSTNVDTKKWAEFLPREPLLRIRYWASVLREFPIECENSFSISNQTVTVRQKFRFHSIRDDWQTKPLKLAPISPPLAAAADEKLKRKLMDMDMPTPFGPYMGFEGVTEWQAGFRLPIRVDTNCAWATFGDCKVDRPNTTLLHAVQTEGWPRIPGCGSLKPSRDQPPDRPETALLRANSRLITYEP